MLLLTLIETVSAGHAHVAVDCSIEILCLQVLAWLDMSNLLLALPMLLVITVRDDTPHFLPLCRCTTFVALFTALTSTCVLVVIAANRFRKLCQPQRSQV